MDGKDNRNVTAAAFDILQYLYDTLCIAEFRESELLTSLYW